MLTVGSVEKVDRVIFAIAKVHGRGRVQLPKEVRESLKVDDGDKIYFIKDELGNILLERAPTLKRERLGKYV